ncbi:MAG: phosphatase PAP2 family protein [Saprospiraceae bacterium]|nr:phosphatase PAP2 family protein [Saprospiraceae bacterium]
MKGKESLSKTKYAEYIRDFTALGNPFLLLLVTFCTLGMLPFEKASHLWILLLIGFMVNEFICSGIKFLWHKPRPNGQTFDSAFEKIDAGSFPSIHSSRISFVYGSLAYVQYFEQNYHYLIVFIFVILLVGYSRIFLKKHFFIDVMAGYGFGLITSVISILLYY